MDLISSPSDVGEGLGGGLLVRALSTIEPVSSPSGLSRSFMRLSPAVLADQSDYSALGAAAARSLVVRAL